MKKTFFFLRMWSKHSVLPQQPAIFDQILPTICSFAVEERNLLSFQQIERIENGSEFENQTAISKV